MRPISATDKERISIRCPLCGRICLTKYEWVDHVAEHDEVVRSKSHVRENVLLEDFEEKGRLNCEKVEWLKGDK